MKHRTHDNLFAAAGVTAALSLIGTGATVLKGSVFHFDHWPLVAGDSARRLDLPTAPLVPESPATQSARQALLAGATRVGGTEALLAGLGGPSGIRSVGLTIPAGAVPSGGSGSGSGSVTAGLGAGGTGAGGAVAGATRDGFGYSVGSEPSGSIDGSRDPAGAPGATSGTRVAPTALDTDGDGIPDTMESDHGAPVAPADPAATGGGSTDRRDTASAFTADPPATPDPATTTPDPTTETTPPGTTTPTPPPADDPAPADPAPADPAPSTDPTPADPTPPADPAPADPAPADPTPPADPAPAPATTPPAPADPAPAGDTTPPAPAPSAVAANAAIPSSAR